MPERLLDGPAASRLREYHLRGVVTFREWEALDARFACQLTWSQMSAALGISRRSARDRVQSGLRKIREHERVAA